MTPDSTKRTIHKGKFLQFLTRGKYEYVRRVNCRGIVIIVAVTDAQRVIFVEQYRLPVDKKVIEFPAGLVDDHRLKRNESAAAAAKRELWEETGYRARKVEKLISGPVASGMTSDQVTMFRASGLKKAGPGGGDQTEQITIHEVPLKSVFSWLRKMEKKGFLVEPKIYAGLYFLSGKIKNFV